LCGAISDAHCTAKPCPLEPRHTYSVAEVSRDCDDAAVDRSKITAELASRLVAQQFPEWADLPLRPVEPRGHDNITFRLGESMSVRLPSGEGYVPQVSKEQHWLPVLAPQLPLPIPGPVAQGVPGCGYPWPWSVYRWLDGQVAAVTPVADLNRFAADLAGFLAALYRIDPTGGPQAGYDTCYFGVALQHWDAQTRESISKLDGQIDTRGVTEVWNAALASRWDGPDQWFHGDIAPGNLLVSDGHLSAVIDFGIAGIGDPACDTAIAWAFFDGDCRETYRSSLPLDEAAWARGRGWALWKALITIALYDTSQPGERAESMAIIEAVVAEHSAL
jgi:aminoglycoside phosphotransferase (APT) family kinase protein